MTLFSNLENLVELDLNRIFNKCKELAGNLMKALFIVCFGYEKWSEELESNLKYEKQRLLSIVAISAVTRNRNINVIQKILGEFFKIKSSNRQVLQLLQRLGLSLVTKALRSDMDVISTHFMEDVKRRKGELEDWDRERKMFENELKSEQGPTEQFLNLDGKVSVRFTSCELIPQILDLSEHELLNEEVSLVPDIHVLEMIVEHGSVRAALDHHLDNCPAAFTVTYDNIDIGSAPNEYITDVTKDQSLHWCSSMIFQDVVTGNELTDNRTTEGHKNVNFSEVVKISEDEKNHLLENYTQLVINLIVKHWPKCLPSMKTQQITHQYTQQFEAGVHAVTGPLVCETESTLEGISVVIKTLVDVVCPSTVNDKGFKSPIYPTTFRYVPLCIY